MKDAIIGVGLISTLFATGFCALVALAVGIGIATPNVAYDESYTMWWLTLFFSVWVQIPLLWGIIGTACAVRDLVCRR